jgi:hypothetical protein
VQRHRQRRPCEAGHGGKELQIRSSSTSIIPIWSRAASKTPTGIWLRTRKKLAQPHGASSSSQCGESANSRRPVASSRSHSNMANSCQVLARHKAVLARDFFRRQIRHTARRQANPKRSARWSAAICLFMETCRALRTLSLSRNVKAVSLGQADWLKIIPHK